MQDSIDELYQRLGRHLRPKIQGNVVLDNRGAVKYRIRDGQCIRTGLTGPVVDYEKSVHGTIIVPTLTKLLWMFSEQAIPKSDGTPYNQRIGGSKNRVIVLTADKRILTNVPFDAKIPWLKVMAIEDILRLIASGMQDYLFVAFGQNVDATLGNNLRRSFDTLELNGTLEFGKYFTVTNTSLSLQTAQALVQSDIDMETLSRIYRLVILNSHEPWQRERLAKLTEPLSAKQRTILPVLRRAEWRDLTCAKILQQQP